MEDAPAEAAAVTEAPKALKPEPQVEVTPETEPEVNACLIT